MKILYLDNNELSGELPTQLGQLSNLQQVSFWDNSLTWADHYENGVVADTVALVAFYESANGDEWEIDAGRSNVTAKDRNWLSYEPLREWYGVTTTGGRVTELVLLTGPAQGLIRTGLSGELPSALGHLTGLKKLVISPRNENYPGVIGGEIPSGLGNMAELQELDLSNNEFGGQIPSELGNLVNLISMNLDNNGFSGEIPPELGNLVNLRKLDFSNNYLTIITPGLGNAANLEELNLSNNKLSGLVPPELGNLSQLKLLYLDNNLLSGELPAQLGNLSNLEQVSVWDNRLTWADHYDNGILADTIALVALYESANGAEWEIDAGRSDVTAKDRNWLSYEPLREWYGVTTTGGRVTELLLVGGSSLGKIRGGFSGEIPSALSNLTGLKKLVLPSEGNSYLPELGGCIPESLHGIEYEGDLPFCTGPTSKKALTPPGASLVG